jgi:hypothetical protein
VITLDKQNYSIGRNKGTSYFEFLLLVSSRILCSQGQGRSGIGVLPQILQRPVFVLLGRSFGGWSLACFGAPSTAGRQPRSAVEGRRSEEACREAAGTGAAGRKGAGTGATGGEARHRLGMRRRRPTLTHGRYEEWGRGLRNRAGHSVAAGG